jgi:hypothetical protein
MSVWTIRLLLATGILGFALFAVFFILAYDKWHATVTLNKLFVFLWVTGLLMLVGSIFVYAWFSRTAAEEEIGSRALRSTSGAT